MCQNFDSLIFVSLKLFRINFDTEIRFEKKIEIIEWDVWYLVCVAWLTLLLICFEFCSSWFAHRSIDYCFESFSFAMHCDLSFHRIGTHDIHSEIFFLLLSSLLTLSLYLSVFSPFSFLLRYVWNGTNYVVHACIMFSWKHMCVIFMKKSYCDWLNVRLSMRVYWFFCRLVSFSLSLYLCEIYEQQTIHTHDAYGNVLEWDNPMKYADAAVERNRNKRFEIHMSAIDCLYLWYCLRLSKCSTHVHPHFDPSSSFSSFFVILVGTFAIGAETPTFKNSTKCREREEEKKKNWINETGLCV